MSRREELSANLAAVDRRIADAATLAGRGPKSVTLVVITKTWPATDVRTLFDLGVRHVGENRDQEAEPKARELGTTELCWHFVGQLQTNKARSVASYAQVVESVDRLRLVDALDRAASTAERVLTCLVQVSLHERGGRGGAPREEVQRLAAAIDDSDHLSLGGVMAVAPLGSDPVAAFDRLGEVARRLRQDHPQADMISAGMSGDLEAAIACGATHVRVGSAVLGVRPPVR